LQLSATVALEAVALLASAPVFAQTEATTRVQVYVDNNATQVVSPLARAAAQLGDSTQISAGCVVDVVTSASVDVVTQASKTTIHDVRTEPWVDLSHSFGRTRLSGGYVYSRERDYVSNGAGAGIEQQLWDNNTTLGLAYRLSLDDVGRAGDANFSRSLAVHSITASWSQVVTSRFLVQVGVEVGYGVGFFASPYRFVPVAGAAGAGPTTWVPETDPDRKVRGAIVVSASRHVFSDSAVQGDYRFYDDDWGLRSHTVELRYVVNLTRNLEIRLRNRFYIQGKADFYQSSYTQIMRYMTFDKELGTLWTDLAGVKLSWRVLSVELEAKVDAFRFRYLDFAPLASRSGANVGFGVSWTR